MSSQSWLVTFSLITKLQNKISLWNNFSFLQTIKDIANSPSVNSLLKPSPRWATWSWWNFVAWFLPWARLRAATPTMEAAGIRRMFLAEISAFAQPVPWLAGSEMVMQELIPTTEGATQFVLRWPKRWVTNHWGVLTEAGWDGRLLSRRKEQSHNGLSVRTDV